MPIEPLATLDYVFASEAYHPTHLILRFAAELDVDGLRTSFIATAREFVGVHATLTRLDERTLAFDLSREAAEVTVVDAEPEKPLGLCGSTIRTSIGEPLARAQVTRLGAGGTVIAFALSHAVADGYSYFLFLRAWAARARGAAFPPPTCNRAALDPSHGGIPASDGRLTHSGFVLEDSPRRAMRMEERWVEPSVLNVSCAEPGDKPAVSENDVLGALLWKECLAGSELAESTFTCPVDVRRHRPNLGPLFFGNASFVASLTLPTEHLRRASVEEVARRIRAAVDAVPTHIDAALQELDHVRRSRGLSVLPSFRSVPSNGGFFITNLSRIPIDVLDFGGGPPLALEPASWPAPMDCGCAVLRVGEKLRLLMAR